jgi:hypothetical protein
MRAYFRNPYVQVALAVLLLASIAGIEPLLSRISPDVDTKLIASWALVLGLLVGLPLYAILSLRRGYVSVWGIKFTRDDAAPIFWLNIATCGVAFCGGLLGLLQLLIPVS